MTIRRTLKTLQCSNYLSKKKKKNNHSTKFKLKTIHTLTMETIFLIITKKEMFFGKHYK